MKAPFLAFLLLAAPLPAAAGQLTDLLMAPGVFADAPEGPLLAYSDERTVPAGVQVKEIHGRLEAAIGAGEHGKAVILTREADGATHPIAEFPASGPNPVLLYFLESTARAMAESTGGSPFYIRNRMREALAAADLGNDGTTVVHPFDGDRNRGRMGVFGDLALTLRYDRADPGRLIELSADTAGDADGYHQTLRLITED